MAEHDEAITAILRGPEVQAMLSEVATDIASRASDLADAATIRRHREKAQYGTDLTVGTDRARAHVWAINGTALHAEAKVAPLLQIIANDGTGGSTPLNNNTTRLDGRNPATFQKWLAAARAANPSQRSEPTNRIDP